MNAYPDTDQAYIGSYQGPASSRTVSASEQTAFRRCELGFKLSTATSAEITVAIPAPSGTHPTYQDVL